MIMLFIGAMVAGILALVDRVLVRQGGTRLASPYHLSFEVLMSQEGES